MQCIVHQTDVALLNLHQHAMCKDVRGALGHWLEALAASFLKCVVLAVHILGFAGMPRHIPDYPNAFAGWNGVASYGSYVSVVGAILFFYVVYKTSTGSFGCQCQTWCPTAVPTQGPYAGDLHLAKHCLPTMACFSLL